MTGLGMPIEGSPGREGPAAAQQHTEKPTPVILMTKPPAPNHASRRRSCEPCRVRKLKCDGTRPICGKCGKRPGMQCIYLGKQKDNSHDPPASLDTIREMVAGNPMSIEGWQMGPEGEVMLKSASGKTYNIEEVKALEQRVQALEKALKESNSQMAAQAVTLDTQSQRLRAQVSSSMYGIPPAAPAPPKNLPAYDDDPKSEERFKTLQALTDVLSEIFDNGLGPNPPSDVNMRSYICDQDDDDEYGDTDSNLSEDGDSDNESRKRIRRSGDGDYSSSSDPLASPGKTSLISPSRPSYTSSASRSSEGRKGNAAGSKTRSSGSSSSISSALFLSQRKQYRHVWSKKELEGLGQDDERRYMEVFFQGAHALPLGLIHKKTYEATYERQLPLLRYAVCTMGSYLSGAPNSPQISLWYYYKARSLVATCCTEFPCLETIQALSIIACCSAARGKMSAAWMLLGMATRMSLFLKLDLDPDDLAPEDSTSLSWIEKETRRRCWWSAYITDRMVAVLTNRCPHLRECYTVRNPRPEHIWELEDVALAEQYYKSPTPANAEGNLYYLARLVDLFGKTADLIRSYPDRNCLLPEAHDQLIKLQAELDDFYVTLPMKLKQAFEGMIDGPVKTKTTYVPPSKEVPCVAAGFGLPLSDSPDGWTSIFLMSLYHASHCMMYRPRVMVEVQLDAASAAMMGAEERRRLRRSWEVAKASAEAIATRIEAAVNSGMELKYLPPFLSFTLFESSLVLILLASQARPTGNRPDADYCRKCSGWLKVNLEAIRSIAGVWKVSMFLFRSLLALVENVPGLEVVVESVKEGGEGVDVEGFFGDNCLNEWMTTTGTVSTGNMASKISVMETSPSVGTAGSLFSGMGSIEMNPPQGSMDPMSMFTINGNGPSPFSLGSNMFLGMSTGDDDMLDDIQGLGDLGASNPFSGTLTGMGMNGSPVSTTLSSSFSFQRGLASDGVSSTSSSNKDGSPAGFLFGGNGFLEDPTTTAFTFRPTTPATQPVDTRSPTPPSSDPASTVKLMQRIIAEANAKAKDAGDDVSALSGGQTNGLGNVFGGLEHVDPLVKDAALACATVIGDMNENERNGLRSRSAISSPASFLGAEGGFVDLLAKPMSTHTSPSPAFLASSSLPSTSTSACAPEQQLKMVMSMLGGNKDIETARAAAGAITQMRSMMRGGDSGGMAKIAAAAVKGAGTGGVLTTDVAEAIARQFREILMKELVGKEGDGTPIGSGDGRENSFMVGLMGNEVGEESAVNGIAGGGVGVSKEVEDWLVNLMSTSSSTLPS